MRKPDSLVAMIGMLLSIFWIVASADQPSAEQIGNAGSFEHDILSSTFGYGPRDLAVEIGNIYQGCLSRDCIRAIDAPEYIGVSEVEFLYDEDLILSVRISGLSRAYPTRILDQHEIVNDWFNEAPVLISWCPLCGSGLAFTREVDGKVVEFGVSGLLHNSDLVMYDRDTESLWQQITGKAIAGPKRGSALKGVPATMVSWSAWKEQHPDGQVLKPPRGANEYARSYYAKYVAEDGLMFPVSREDARLKPKQVIFGVEAAGQSFALASDWLEGAGQWKRDTNAGQLVVTFDEGAGVGATLDGETIPIHRMFWFAWYSFHPETVLVDQDHRHAINASGDGHDMVQITLPSLDGHSVSTSDLRGQWVVLNYWATWCAPCRKEIPELNALHAERDDVTVLGLAFEDTDPENFSFFLEDFDVSYPILLVDIYDPPEPFGSPKVLPTTHILDPGGSVAESFFGPVTRDQIEGALEAMSN